MSILALAWTLVGGWLKRLLAIVASIASRINLQGWLGIAASLCLALMWLGAKSDVRHWHKSSDRFEALYHAEQAAFATTVANYRAAQVKADALAKANVERATAAQQAITERTTHDFETRIADARARAGRLSAVAHRADPGSTDATRLPATGPTAGGADGASAQGGLSPADALIATEQAIQLDELISWNERQAKVRN